MAIQAQFGDYEAAYIRVDEYNGMKDDVGIIVYLYENEEERNNDNPFEVQNYTFTYDTDSADGILQQAYTYLKAMDTTFINATDV